jgi:hypothetical protein
MPKHKESFKRSENNSCRNTGKALSKIEQQMPKHKESFDQNGNNRCRNTRKDLSEMGTIDAETQSKI